MVTRPFYFMVAFWGEEHRGYFLNWQLPSLLAGGNIPALGAGSKFLISTTDRDWAELQSHESFLRLAEYVEPVRFPLDDDPDKIRRSGRAFGRMVDYAHAAGCYGFMLTPDQIISNNTIVALQEMASAGIEMVLVSVVRASKERLFTCLGSQRSISASRLSSIVSHALHPEMDGYEWDGPYWPDVAGYYWKRSIADGLVHHAIHWQPILIDYSRLKQHNTQRFLTHSFDGGYVWDNLQGLRYEAIFDTSRIFIASHTPEREGPHHRPMPWWLSWSSLLRRVCHAYALRRTLELDFLQNFPKELLLQPILWTNSGRPLPLEQHLNKRPHFSIWLLKYLAAHIEVLHRAYKGDPECRELLTRRCKELLCIS